MLKNPKNGLSGFIIYQQLAHLLYAPIGVTPRSSVCANYIKGVGGILLSLCTFTADIEKQRRHSAGVQTSRRSDRRADSEAHALRGSEVNPLTAVCSVLTGGGLNALGSSAASALWFGVCCDPANNKHDKVIRRKNNDINVSHIS